MNKKSILFLLLIASFAHAQTILKGIVIEKGGVPLPGAGIAVMNMDSSMAGGASSSTNGFFQVKLESGKSYIMKCSYIGYETRFRNFEATPGEIDFGKIFMPQAGKNLGEVEVKGVQQRGEQRGDTTSFNSDAFKTHPDATAEDLIKKMPGVTSDNSGIKVNGEQVKKVLVDGKPFFGDDPMAATKNLPSEVIDRVEFFDKMSDQSAFTGFNDGDVTKTMNFITKKGKNIGQFGRLYAGAGSDEAGEGKWNTGAVINSFNSKQRVSLLMMSNNINQQNFSIADIVGAMGNTGGGGGRGMGGMGGGGGFTASSRGGGGGGGFGQSMNLFVGNQNGVSTTHSGGLNYSDEWGKKISVSGSYFSNYSQNVNYATVRRNYFSKDQLIYDQLNDDRTNNLNHRFNFRLEYNVDSANKIIFTPSFTYQDNLLKSSLTGSNTVLDSVLLSSTQTHQRIGNSGYDASGNLLLQHKFRKDGRTLSLNLFGQQSEKNNQGNYLSLNKNRDTITGLDQMYFTYGNTRRASASINYTEPLNKFSQMQINYSPSYNDGYSNKVTNDYDALVSQYLDFNSALSNRYVNFYITQRVGWSYRYNKDKLRLNFGADVQEATLKGDQTYPTEFKVGQNFSSILPNAEMNYKITRSNNLRVNYRTNTNIPNMTQLQNVLDISNPLQVKTGNNSLKQTYEHNFSMRVGGFNIKTQKNIMLFINGGITDNYITNANYTIRRDTMIQNYLLKAGSQLSKPINMNGYYNARAFVTYGFAIKAIKSNVNVNGGLNYSHAPAMTNNIINYADNYTYNAGIFLGSNISQNFDFSFGYNGSYTDVMNSAQKQSNNSYFNHGITAKINIILFKGLVINTEATQTIYNGLSQGFDQEFLLWNAYVGYKLLKDKSMEAKISVFDILKQNKSVSRTFNSNYTEDNISKVLQRYGLFTLTYSLRNFKKGTPPKDNEPENPYREMWRKNGGMMPGGGMPPHMPGGGG